MKRCAIVSDASGQWFIRGIFSITHDLDRDHKVYRCDTHEGGPFKSVMEAAASLAARTAVTSKERRDD